MTEGHRAHLCASLGTLEDAVRDITAIAREGRSPTSGQKLTPLAPSDWAVVDACLHRAVERVRRVVETVAPDYLTDREQAEGLGGTVFRLSLLLRSLEEELVEGLHPRRMEVKFGSMADEEKAALSALVEGMRSDLGEIRILLERLRRRRE